MQEIPEITRWIKISVDLGSQFFHTKLHHCHCFHCFEKHKTIYVLEIKERLQGFQFFMDDVTESKKILHTNYDKQHTTTFLCVLQDFLASYSSDNTLHWLGIECFPKYFISWNMRAHLQRQCFSLSSKLFHWFNLCENFILKWIANLILIFHY